MKTKTSKLIQYASYPLCFFLGLIISNTTVFQYSYQIFFPPAMQTLRAPGGHHKATLAKKFNLADINFVVSVDGQRVYTSADYAGYPDGFYRETLQWDKSGRIVLLELLGKRVFAYDTAAKRSLNKGELQSYDFKPDKGIYTNYAQIKDLDE